MAVIVVGNLQVLTGTTAQRTAYTPLLGEIVFDTTSKTAYIGDGTTAGGLPIAASGATAWGNITGTLSAQTDLSTALAAKAGLTLANVFTNQQAVTPYRASITGAVSIDLSATGKSNNLHLTLSGNVTSFALTNPADGAVYNIRWIQGTTPFTVAGLPASFKFAGGIAPSFSNTANAIDFMSLEYGSTEGTYMVSFLKGMA